MKKLLLLITLYTGLANAQNVVDNQLSIGTVNRIDSKILQEERTVWVSLPTSYYKHQFARTHYPVIYVLDGDANFAAVSAIAKQLSVRNGNTEFPEVIVVGILNTDRERDFSPTKSDFFVYGKLPQGTKTGGGEKFTAFIQKELIPYIDAAYPTLPYKVLIGHSLGGLAATNVLINHSRLFNSYIIVDPSMWWDNRNFLRHATEVLEHNRFDGNSVFLSIANNMRSDVDTSALRSDTSMSTFHTRSIFLFKDALQKNNKNGLRFSYKFYAAEPHMSAPLISIYDGLHFIFGAFTMPSGWIADFFDPYNKTDPARLFTDHYLEVSKKMGYKILPSENLVNNFANTALNSEMPQKALGLYELNVVNYPESFGAYDSLGDFYASQKSKVKARETYLKALKIAENAVTRKKLNALDQN